MSEEELVKQLAQLEFVNDQLTCELRYVDDLLKSIGFPEGLDTVKRAAHDLQEKTYLDPDLD